MASTPLWAEAWRLAGKARDVLDHPEIADLYLGGHVAPAAT